MAGHRGPLIKRGLHRDWWMEAVFSAELLGGVDDDDARNHRALALRSGISVPGARASCAGTEAVEYLGAPVAHCSRRDCKPQALANAL